MTQSNITGLFIYPIKSCGPVALDAAQVVRGGFQFDRRYMLVDDQGRFITARAVPRLLQVEMRLVTADRPAFLADHPDMRAPLELPAHGLQDGERIQVEVWRDRPWATVLPPGSAWFSALLGGSARLVYLGESDLRQVNPERSRPGDVVSFADGYPLLVTNEQSLHALNRRLSTPVEMGRFRPNVVYSGRRPFEEDYWAQVNLGAIDCDAPKLCDRCVMTTVDVTTGRTAKEPLATLAKFRRWCGAVWFGMNVIPRRGGLLQLGDAVEAALVREHPSLLG
jgi:uncharacterized protein YcbX